MSSALITGASSGIGRGLALQLAKRGTKVHVAARRKPELESLVAEIRHAGGAAELLELDVSDADHTEAVVRDLDRRDPLDLVIANAGIGEFTPGNALEWPTVKRIMQVNVMGALATLCGAAPGMVARRRGHLAAVSSLAAFRGLPKNGGYSASKAALNTFLESIRLDLHGSGVAVTAICPGFVETEMTAGMGKMPFMMSRDRAVDIILRSLDHRDAVCAFPAPLSLPMRMLGVMPNSVYSFVGNRLRRFMP